MPPAQPRAEYKVVLLGEGRVGKTSLVVRFCRDTFADGQPPTIQASCLERTVRVLEQPVKLNIWDTAGQERFHALGPIYYRDADAALIVYDITDTDTFARAKVWVKELRKMVGQDIVLSLVGNKSDLERSRTVPKEAASEYAASVGAAYSETSAKLSRGIEECFLDLSTRLQRARAAKPAAPGGLASMVAHGPRSGRGSVPMITDEPLPKPGGGCC